MGENQQKNRPNFQQYQAAEYELSNRQLSAATWYVKNRRNLRIFGIALMILFCVLTVGYSTFKWGEYIIFGYVEDGVLIQQQLVEFENYAAMQPYYEARPLVLRQSTVLRSGADRYDFVTEVTNPNDRWVAQVRYKYVYSGGETQEETALILPGQLHLLPVLGFERNSFPSQTRLVLLGTEWRRISPHRIFDVPGYIAERVSFSLDEVRSGENRTDGAPSNSVLFSIRNNSSYSYWETEFLVAFFDRGSLVAVRPLIIHEFYSQEVEPVDFRLTDLNGRISEVDIVPIVNVFDSSLFIDPGEIL